MGEIETRSEEAFRKLSEKLDALGGHLAALDTTQKQMAAQLEVSAVALQKADQHQHDALLHFDATNTRFDALARQVDLTAAAVTRLQREQVAVAHGEVDTDPSLVIPTGRGILTDLPEGFTASAAIERGAPSQVAGVCEVGGGVGVGGWVGGLGGGRTTHQRPDQASGGAGGMGGGVGGRRTGRLTAAHGRPSFRQQEIKLRHRATTAGRREQVSVLPMPFNATYAA